MKKLSMIVLAVLASTACLVGCNDDSNSVNADGTCTQNLVDDWNSLSDQYRALKHALAVHGDSSTQAEDQIRGLDAECQNFLTQHSNVSCQVADPVSGDEKTLDTSLVNGVCADAANAVDQYNQEEALPVTPANPIPPVVHARPNFDDYSPLRTVANAGVLYAFVLDAYSANRLIQNGDLAIQNGNILNSGDVSANGVYCKLIQSGTGSDFTLDPGERLQVYMSSESEANAVSSTRVYFSGKGYALDCTKFESQPFSVGDLREGVSGMFSLTIDNN